MVFSFPLDLGVFHIGKRTGYFVHWEPIYIGTHADPHYDERLSWEGKSDKMTQVQRIDIFIGFLWIFLTLHLIRCFVSRCIAGLRSLRVGL